MSLIRVPLAFMFFHALYHQNLEEALLCLVVAGISDKLDGTLARRLGMGDNLWGKILDPFADRIFMIVSFSSLYLVKLEITLNPWVIFLTVGQDLLLAPLGIYVLLKKKKFLGSPLGKPVTFYQYVFLIMLLSINLWKLKLDILIFEILLILLNLLSAIHHIYLWLLDRQS
ncbi:MAG: CDP-alcohol phosphatidyltransferase family protein [Thermodesulfobacteriaceae bacterium]|nr:CDP-alcohol phosphatidyltransferase family protein [Thermodesulfobacteriaceae bacterium]MCX8040877.1 CDP-alcohol phosphatidyltransferase family protein [Thermodesulfobacteriaceae bacterium]MDW8136277.1 CDP-alcohol phosphatidyltransferase family protein [Thermodesulfobacterium sp.]